MVYSNIVVSIEEGIKVTDAEREAGKKVMNIFKICLDLKVQ
jgi:hypothetical protein